MMVFGRKRKEKRENLNQKVRNIEEVTEFKYLGFIFKDSGKHDKHIKELRTKERNAAKGVWGSQSMRKDQQLRLEQEKNTFSYLVKSNISYEAEIWRWRERKELERVQNDYYRWSAGLDFCTPLYFTRRELNIGKMAED